MICSNVLGMTNSRADYISSILADWPPLTLEQKAVINNNLHGADGFRRPTPASASELSERKKARERDAAMKAARKASLAMTACDVCNLRPEVHRIRQANSVDMHEWQSGRAEKLMKRAVK